MNRFKVVFLGASFLVLTALLAFRPAETEHKGIQWMTFEQMQAAQKKKPKKVIIDIYTDWCGWCKKMDKTTFEQPAIAKYVNDNFYAVKFDAESKPSITFAGKVYNNPQRYHELAMKLMDGKAGFPTSVYLDETLKPITPPIASYLDAKQFELIINYLNTESYKRVSFDQYSQEFKSLIQQ